ncbi:MAG: AbrB/MazE/SpoVT family DNA-binding domain-containing protein [Nanoarchaeota archaeon]|mgnify:CR=1 FL=1
MIVEMSKGRQITIPAKMRNELDLVMGSKLEITKRGDEIILKPLGDDLDKMFKEAKNVKPKHNLTAKQMDELNEGVFR